MGPCAPRVPNAGMSDFQWFRRMFVDAFDRRRGLFEAVAVALVLGVLGGRWRPRGDAVRVLFEATRQKMIRLAVMESLGMAENSDVREGWMHEARGPYGGSASGGLRAWGGGNGRSRRQNGLFVSSFGSAWLGHSWRLLLSTPLGRGFCEITKTLLDLDERNQLPKVLVEAGPLGVEVRASKEGRVSGLSVRRGGAQLCSSLVRGCRWPFVGPRVILFKCGVFLRCR